MLQGKAKYVHYIIRRGEAELRILELTSVFHHLHSVGPKQFCVLAHLGCTREVSTSLYILISKFYTQSIGAAVDSYYEYLVKGSALLQKPELMKMFLRSREAIEQYMNHDDWHFWVSMKVIFHLKTINIQDIRSFIKRNPFN